MAALAPNPRVHFSPLNNDTSILDMINALTDRAIEYSKNPDLKARIELIALTIAQMNELSLSLSLSGKSAKVIKGMMTFIQKIFHESTVEYLQLSKRAVDIENAPNCVIETRNAMKVSISEAPACLNYHEMIENLERVKGRFPQIYQLKAINPLLNFMKGLGKEQFQLACNREPLHFCYLISHIYCAILEGAQPSQATKAFQEIVDDVYVSFVSAEKRASVLTGNPIKPPDFGMVPPLVMWEKASSRGYESPYTFSVSSLLNIFVSVPVVCLPHGVSKGGLFAWQMLGHEVAGHDILRADLGLINELQHHVSSRLKEEGQEAAVCNYWTFCLEEAASDVMGVLHFGPTAAMGLVCFFRARRKEGKLSCIAIGGDNHPVDILRAVVVAETVRLLQIHQSEEWAKKIEECAIEDLNQIQIFQHVQLFPVPIAVSPKNEVMITSAKLVAQVIVTTPLQSLENHSLSEIRRWGELDETLVNYFSQFFRGSPPSAIEEGLFAPHIVAAASQIALKKETGNQVNAIFQRMIHLLNLMHSTNPNWKERYFNLIPKDHRLKTRSLT